MGARRADHTDTSRKPDGRPCRRRLRTQGDLPETLDRRTRVPCSGGARVRLHGPRCSIKGRCKFGSTYLDNGIVQVFLDRWTGNITSVQLKAQTPVFVDAAASGGLNTFYWQPARGAGGPLSDTVLSVVLRESGPLVGEISATSTAPGCRSVTRSVRLVDGEPQVEITNVVDKLPLLAKDPKSSDSGSIFRIRRHTSTFPGV